MLQNSKLLLHILHQIEQEGGPEGAWLSQEGLEGALVHLFMAKEDASMSKKLAQEQAQVQSGNSSRSRHIQNDC